MSQTLPPAVVPVAKKTSPWIWGAIGCGSVLVLIVLAVTVGGLVLGRKVSKFARDAEKNPVVAAARMMIKLNPEIEEVSSDASAGTITIRNKKTGETMTMNAADIQEGRMSFTDAEGKKIVIEGGTEGQSGSFRMETPEGAFEMKTGSADIPAWIPVYPGAGDSQAWSMSGPDGDSGGVTFSAADKVEDVIAHYEKVLKAAGYEVTTSTFQQNDKTEGGMLNAVSGAEKRQISVLLATDEDRSQVTVNYGPHQ